MPYFHYKVVNANGESLEGELEARDRESLIVHLHELDQTPLHVEEVGRGVDRKRHIRLLQHRFDISRFSRDIAILLKAGIPLDAALQVLLEIAEEQPAQTIRRILDDVRSGKTLSHALGAMPNLFTPFYISMVKAAEAAGALELVMGRLADFNEQLDKLKDNIKSALIYPAILFFVTIMSLLVLMTYVVPQFNELFEGMQHELPLPSRIVFSIAAVINQHGWWVVTLIALSLLFLWQRLRDMKSSYLWDKRLLSLPLVGDLVLKIQVSIFARTLSTLLSSGVSLLSALNIVKDTLSNRVISQAVSDIADNVKEGSGLARPMMASGEFPRFVVQMIRVGEESGKLGDTLNQLANIYDDEVRTAVSRLLVVIEPVLIIGLGVIIGGVIMSILMAVLSINELAL